MSRKLIVEFTKMDGAGNDFIVIDDRFYNFTDRELSDLARALCPRRHGIGADGILAFATPTGNGVDFRMRYVNADGSIGTMCGNGARCLARYARHAGIAATEMRIETDAGAYEVAVPEEDGASVRLFVPLPRHWRAHQDLAGALPEAIASVHYLWTGTEHVVCFVGDVQKARVTAWGRSIRQDARLAPEGANVNFVQVLSKGAGGALAELRVRTYEKGVEAETLACGTGALASTLAAHFLGKTTASEARIHMPGGVLGVGFKGQRARIARLWLDGPATTVYRGTVAV